MVEEKTSSWELDPAKTLSAVKLKLLGRLELEVPPGRGRERVESHTSRADSEVWGRSLTLTRTDRMQLTKREPSHGENSDSLPSKGTVGRG